MESMSNVPFYAEDMRWGNKYGNSALIDGIAKDGLTDVYDGLAMGNAADMCAAVCGISREEQDAFAIESYKRSQAAWNNGAFAAEVVPVEVPQRKGDAVTVSRDDEPFAVKFEKVASLRPAFSKEGTVTAANASTMNDGAAALVLTGSQAYRRFECKAASKDIELCRCRTGTKMVYNNTFFSRAQSGRESRVANGRH